MNWWRKIFVPLFTFALEATHLEAAHDTAFWIWQRAEPLQETERAELQAQRVTTLYWHAGEIDYGGGQWRWKGKPVPVPHSDEQFRIVPVIRLASTARTAFDDEAVRGLVDQISRFLAAHADQKTRELQIDFDCPDRVLGRYAEVLKTIHALTPKLSITALVGWTKNPAWPALQASIDEIAPMFYDSEPDPLVNRDHPPLPLIGTRKIDAQLAAWSACKIPWRAGLPAFARVSLYDAGGKSRGHIRNFTWDEICFSKALKTIRATETGTTLWRVETPTRIANTPLHPGELLATRWPDRDVLQHALDTAKRAGASGVIFFRLPDRTDPSGWSLRQLGALTEAKMPGLALRRTGEGKLQLVNESTVDLAPQFAVDRGYALEIDAASPIWREALEGDFWSVVAQVNGDPNSRPVPIPLATRLTFRFSHLRAGESLTSGLLQLAPNAALNELRWRILDGEKAKDWRRIE